MAGRANIDAPAACSATIRPLDTGRCNIDSAGGTGNAERVDGSTEHELIFSTAPDAWPAMLGW